MNKFSPSSEKKLKTCDPRIIEVVTEALQKTDLTVLYGYRTEQEQLDLFNQGREFYDGTWVVVDKKKVVTNCDGYNIKSKHNSYPSKAIDIAPYPIDWDDIESFKKLASEVLAIAKSKNIPLKWGGDFKTLKDYPHFEL